MLHTEVRFHWSNSLLFNLKNIILWVSLSIVQYNTIFTKKVQIYFEVMITFIIAVTSSARRINVMPLCSILANFLNDDITLVMNLYMRLTLSSQPLLNSNPLHQAGWVWFALSPIKTLPWCFSTVFIWKRQADNNVCEITRILFGLGMFYILQSWAVLHCWITWLFLQKTYLVSIVWLLL